MKIPKTSWWRSFLRELNMVGACWKGLSLSNFYCGFLTKKIFLFFRKLKLYWKLLKIKFLIMFLLWKTRNTFKSFMQLHLSLFFKFNLFLYIFCIKCINKRTLQFSFSLNLSFKQNWSKISFFLSFLHSFLNKENKIPVNLLRRLRTGKILRNWENWEKNQTNEREEFKWQ